MNKRPTYEELRQRVEKSEKELAEARSALEVLAESERRFRAIFDQTFQFIGLMAVDGTMIEANKTALKFVATEASEVIGKPFWKTPWWRHSTELQEHLREAVTKAATGRLVRSEVTYHAADGALHYGDLSIKPFKDEAGNVTLLIPESRDITDRVKAEEELKKAHNELERRVKQRTEELEIKTKNLEEFNTAMEVLLKKREEDRIGLEDNVLSNVNEFILPYFKKLNHTLDDRQRTFLEIIESNLKEIISPFSRRLTYTHSSLTPTEIKVANLVKHGSTTKEIAEIMNISVRTVDTHRKHIRKKIGIENQKANLRSYLQSFQ